MQRSAFEARSETGPPRIPGIELDQIIGEGSAGVVYAGRQLYLDRPIAVKILKRSEISSQVSFVHRFQREAQILAALRHPHIVACYQAGVTDQNDDYLAMELIDGPNLHQWLIRYGALSEYVAIEVVRKIAGALNYAFEHGIIHRDVKAENILLERSAGGDATFPFEPKLADLGIARAVGRGDLRLTVASQLLGTPRNMAPEQFSDPEHVDFRADLYGLGCILFQMLTGVHPFAESDPSRIVMDKARVRLPDLRAVRPTIESGVECLLRALLAPDKEQRPSSYAEVISTCERLRTAITAAPGRRRSMLGTLAALGCIATLLLLIVPRELDRAELQARSEPYEAAPQPPLEVRSTTAVVFDGPAQALIGPTVLNPFPGWEPSAGSGVWIAEEEGGGVNGVGSGQKAHRVGPAPWCVAGSIALLTEDSKEAGIRIELDSGGALVLALKQLGKLYAALSEIPGPQSLESPRVLRFMALEHGLFNQIPFRLEVLPDRVEAHVAGLPLATATTHGSGRRLALFVDHATASFRGLELRGPTARRTPAVD